MCHNDTTQRGWRHDFNLARGSSTVRDYKVTNPATDTILTCLIYLQIGRSGQTRMIGVRICRRVPTSEQPRQMEVSIPIRQVCPFWS